MSDCEPTTCSNFLLQIDRVGSYRLLLTDSVWLGGPQETASENGVQILGPLARHHVEIRRDAAGYTITPQQGSVHLLTEKDVVSKTPASQPLESAISPTGNLLTGKTRLCSRSEFELASGIRCQLEKKSPLSQTALLQISPRERLRVPVEGIVLLDRLLILGPGESAHIVCRHWKQAGVLLFQAGRFLFRSPLGLDSEEIQEKIDLELPLQRYVNWEECGFYLEAIKSDPLTKRDQQ